MSAEAKPVRHVKVVFEIEDSWAPVGSEAMHCVPLEGDRYRLANSPWFVKGVSIHDVVEAVADADGPLRFVRVVEGGWRTLALVTSGGNPHEIARPIIDLLRREFAAECEFAAMSENVGLFSAALPPHVDPDAVDARIAPLVRSGMVEFEWLARRAERPRRVT